jgi:alpha-tubulin suppressor-like RCC1 family protein
MTVWQTSAIGGVALIFACGGRAAGAEDTGEAGSGESSDATGSSTESTESTGSTDEGTTESGETSTGTDDGTDESSGDGTDSTTGNEDPPAVVEIDAGRFHACARAETDAIRCWGWGTYGTLGYGNTEDIGDDEVPAAAGDVDIGDGGRPVELVAGSFHNCLRFESGGVKCWGAGLNGRLGYANTDSIGDDETPAAVGEVDLGGSVVQLSAGFAHTCALMAGGTVRCWGRELDGNLGHGDSGDIGDDETPASMGDVDVGGEVVQVAAGTRHSCARLAAGTVRCWGAGQYGQLGYGDQEDVGDDETPASAGDVDVGGTVVWLTAGYHHTCVLLEGGTVRCWGHAEDGRLGYGDLEDVGDDETPASVGDVDIGGTVLELRGGEISHCALLDGDAVRCWGLGELGLLGYGNENDIGDDETPASAGDVVVGGTVVEIALGGHTCARLDTGRVRCWGTGEHGAAGYGNTENVGDDEFPAAAGDVEIF